MIERQKILHLEDAPEDAEIVSWLMKKLSFPYELKVVTNKEEYIAALEDYVPDIVISDHSMPAFNSIDALRMIRDKGLKTPFILVTATVSDEFAVSILKKGANDYILKERMERLPNAVETALETFWLEKEKAENEQRFRCLIEHSMDMLTLISADGSIEYISPAVENILGYTIDKKYAQQATGMAFPGDIPAMQAQLKEALAKPGMPVPSVIRQIKKDGSYIWAEGTFTNMLHIPGLHAIVANFKDVTAHKEAERALRESEYKFRSLIQHSSDAITVINEKQEIIFASDSLYRITGFTVAEMLNEPSRQYVHPDDIPFINKKFHELINNPGKTKYITYRRLKKDGTYFWCEGVATNLIHEPAVGGIVINFRDISERRETEEKLQQSFLEIQAASERQSAIINSLNAHIALLDNKGRIIGVNESWEKFTEKNNLSNADYGVGHDYISISGNATGMNKDTTTAMALGIKDVLSGNLDEFSMEYSCHSPSGELWFRANITPLSRNPENGVVISHTDITESKLSHVAMQRSEANMNTIFNNGDTIYILLDCNLNIVSFNQLAGKYAEEEMIAPLEEGAYLPGKISAEKRPAVYDALQNILKHKEISHESEYRLSANPDRWYHTRYFPVVDEKREVFGIIIAINDITERTLEERKTLKLLELLQKKNKDLSQFTYIVSHNLRAPIAKIMGLVTLYEPGAANEAANKDLVEYIASETTNLDNVVKDLNAITLARDFAGEVREFVTFEDELALILKVFEKEIAECHASITFQFQEKRVFTIKSYLYSIMFNLISNAIKYRSPHQDLTIHLQTKRENDFISLSVADNGMGINLAKNSRKIFGLYRRFHGDGIPGKGIGLYLVKAQAETLGGTVDVNSEVNEGTTFKISIPI